MPAGSDSQGAFNNNDDNNSHENMLIVMITHTDRALIQGIPSSILYPQ